MMNAAEVSADRGRVVREDAIQSIARLITLVELGVVIAMPHALELHLGPWSVV